MILFKRQPEYPEIEREFTQLDKRLYPILYTMETVAWHAWKDHLVVTRIKEAKNDQSTHYHQQKPYRHIDIAVLESGLENSELLRKFINVFFPYAIPMIKGYDTIPDLEHGTAAHFHVQCKALK